MKTKLIIKIDTEKYEEDEEITRLSNLLGKQDCVLLSGDMEILIKDKEGYWSKI